MLQKDDFTAISSALRQYLPERETPYILDVDLDFFSTKNPFKALHDHVNLYDKLGNLYNFKRPDSEDPEVSTNFKIHITASTMLCWTNTVGFTYPNVLPISRQSTIFLYQRKF